ncbi:MAG: site-specific integrase [Verrucomicrobiota bacterium]|nr:site-specific integrase [Verrucomicrobiota bacterium]
MMKKPHTHKVTILDEPVTFKIKPFENRGGSISYCISGSVGGKQIRVNRSSVDACIGWANEYANERNLALLSQGQFKTINTRLSEAQLTEAETAFQKLAGEPLLDAVEYYLQNKRASEKRIRFDAALVEYLGVKENGNLRPTTMKSMETRLRTFEAAGYDNKMVHEITPAIITSFLNRPGSSPVNQRNYRLALSGFFGWAFKAGYVRENPIAKVDCVVVEQGEPVALSNGQVRKLLQAALEYEGGKTVPFFALALFAGLRPNELGRLSWQDIDLEQKLITVGAKIAKMRQRRNVEISDNLIDWLLPHAAKRTPIACSRACFDRVKILAGWRKTKLVTPSEREANRKLPEWPVDVLRHTAISNHYVKVEHEGKTASWAGNSPEMIHRHYRGLVKAVDAKEFWSLTPRNIAGEVVKIPSGRKAG